MPRIFLDLDDTLVCLQEGVLKRLNFPDTFKWPSGVWDMATALATPHEKIWPQISDHEFWANLEPLPWCFELVNLAERLVGKDSVFILSKPTLSPFSSSGKMEWLGKHLPAMLKEGRFVLTPQKAVINPLPDDVLVDDSPKNYEAFTGAGGRCLLVPRPHNHRYAEDPRVILVELENMITECAVRCRTSIPRTGSGCSRTSSVYGTANTCRMVQPYTHTKTDQ